MMFAAFILTALAAPFGVFASDFVYERLDKDEAGLTNAVRDFEPGAFKQQALAHAAFGIAFDLPVIITTSTEDGPNGRTLAEITDMYPDVPIVRRGGEVNAWDNEEFRDAVAAANKTQIILGGIVTDVCTTHLALSLRQEGYQVFANVEGSGATSVLSRETGNARMREAGVQILTAFSIWGELMRDWRGTPGALELFPWLDTYLPPWGGIARAHARAVTNGTILPGQDKLPF